MLCLHYRRVLVRFRRFAFYAISKFTRLNRCRQVFVIGCPVAENWHDFSAPTFNRLTGPNVRESESRRVGNRARKIGACEICRLISYRSIVLRPIRLVQRDCARKNEREKGGKRRTVRGFGAHVLPTDGSKSIEGRTIQVLMKVCEMITAYIRDQVIVRLQL